MTSVYGSVLVSSPLNRAEILLDGGSVGKIEPGGPTLLSVVRAGEREVGVRDNSGREIRRWVRVQEGRTVLVELSEAAATGVADYPLSHAGSNAQGYEEYRRSRDGATVVRIPGGEFLMGNKETERQPLEHRVSVWDVSDRQDGNAGPGHSTKRSPPLPPGASRQTRPGGVFTTTTRRRL